MGDLLYYQHQRLGCEFHGVPGIWIQSFAFSLLDSLFSKAARIDRQAFQDVIVVPDGDHLFVSTHLESSDAGHRICDILSRVSRHPLEMEFVENFRHTIIKQNHYSRRWIANGRRIFQLELSTPATS